MGQFGTGIGGAGDGTAADRGRVAEPTPALQAAGALLADHAIELVADERGVHVETLLGLLGANGGYACQASLRAQGAAGGSIRLMEAVTADGQRFYYGDAINHYLLEGRYSLWSLTIGMAEHLGARDLPDAIDTARHVAATLGTPAFGEPRLPEEHLPGINALGLVRRFWPGLKPEVARLTSAPEEWPMLFGFAIQNVMAKAVEVIPPGMAARVALEYAVPGAKLDPAVVGSE